jgi:hypothetical protein
LTVQVPLDTEGVDKDRRRNTSQNVLGRLLSDLARTRDESYGIRRQCLPNSTSVQPVFENMQLNEWSEKS